MITLTLFYYYIIISRNTRLKIATKKTAGFSRLPFYMGGRRCDIDTLIFCFGAGRASYDCTVCARVSFHQAVGRLSHLPHRMETASGMRHRLLRCGLIIRIYMVVKLRWVFLCTKRVIKCILRGTYDCGSRGLEAATR